MYLPTIDIIEGMNIIVLDPFFQNRFWIVIITGNDVFLHVVVENREEEYHMFNMIIGF